MAPWGELAVDEAMDLSEDRQTSNDWTRSAALTHLAMKLPSRPQQISIAAVGWQIPQHVAQWISLLSEKVRFVKNLKLWAAGVQVRSTHLDWFYFFRVKTYIIKPPHPISASVYRTT